MRKSRYSILIIITITMLFYFTAYADSSWVWISETRPRDILPLTAALTLLIETVTINKIPEINRPLRVFLSVAAANLLSFASPYIILAADGVYNSFGEALNSYPYYTVGMFYLFLTLAVEWPLVRELLKKYAKNERLLNKAIIGSNIVTTIMVAVIERTLCRGHW